MKKIVRLVTFIGLAGAALAGLWYFLDARNNACDAEDADATDCESDTTEQEDKEEACERAYVSIKTDEASDKEALTKAVTDAVKESIAKADEAAEGLGVVKEDKIDKANDFEFKSFDESKED